MNEIKTPPSVKTDMLSLEEVRKCLTVCLFSFWKRVRYKHPIILQHLPDKTVIAHLPDKTKPATKETLMSFSPQFPLTNKLYKFLFASASENENILQRINGFLNKKSKEKKEGAGESRLRRMLALIIAEQSTDEFPWRWKLDHDGDQLIDQNGHTVFWLPSADGYSYKTLENIIAVKQTSNPFESNRPQERKKAEHEVVY